MPNKGLVDKISADFLLRCHTIRGNSNILFSERERERERKREGGREGKKYLIFLLESQSSILYAAACEKYAPIELDDLFSKINLFKLEKERCFKG